MGPCVCFSFPQCVLIALSISKAHSIFSKSLIKPDAAIDQMVYALYNLTEEEIKIVEVTNNNV
jgi:hypothetical protein